ncbi:MAG: Rrf2 family transcriptional regulator [Coriobacteriales bacterium]|nr:Rrf2 family transcriptional regulator [Coriobacteriales bacterium]
MSTLISTRGRYALRALTDIAKNQADGLVPLADVSRRQGISEKYLESIATALSKAGFISGQRGKGGGYCLAKDPEDCALGEVLSAVEGSIVPVACLECGPNGCDNRELCPTLPMWEQLDNIIHDYLDGKTLADLMKIDTGVTLPCTKK